MKYRPVQIVTRYFIEYCTYRTSCVACVEHHHSYYGWIGACMGTVRKRCVVGRSRLECLNHSSGWIWSWRRGSSLLWYSQIRSEPIGWIVSPLRFGSRAWMKQSYYGHKWGIFNLGTYECDFQNHSSNPRYCRWYRCFFTPRQAEEIEC